MEEYIRLEEEKARRRGKVFNWETATYVFNDKVSSETLSCEPMVSSLNDEIYFRVSFDDFDDEDYTVRDIQKKDKKEAKKDKTEHGMEKREKSKSKTKPKQKKS
uniref:Uncharacterized protein n=1 Tax=Tanacetum cinerariifolium TaxID=118510 RepID=A0A699GJR6_TANCI|nr:hypothetical protein [Tanacetum cinerariifolium]